MLEFPTFPSEYWAEQRGECLALRWEKGNSTLFPYLPQQLSWQALQHLISQCAYLLALKKGELQNHTVAYIGEHRLAGLLCYLSVIALGGRIVMLNPAMPKRQQQMVLSDLHIDLVLTDEDFVDFEPDLPACTFPPVCFRQAATLTLTSGSSGIPKAVVHSVEQHLINASGVCQLLHFKSTDCWLLSLPMFHVSGQGIVWRWLQQGAMLVVGEDKAQFYSLLAACSHASLVPTQLQRYLAQKQSDIPQHILLGGSYLPPELMLQAQAQQITTYAGYGMTEMASTICAVAQEVDNVGTPLAFREVKLVGDEIYLRGDCLALGYWQQGKLTPLPLDNGWFATKDRGKWNDKGHLQVIGRLDNMFISGGENIQPEEIELCLYRSGVLKQIFVLPIENSEFGYRPVAFVEFIGDYSEQAVTFLQHFAQSELEKFKQPVAYYPLESQLQQAGIKISRKQLAQYLHGLLNKERNNG